MKTLALIARRKDLSRRAFRDHYEDTHAPLAIRTVLDGTTRYVRSHVAREIHGEPRFDVVTAFWYADASAALAVQQRLATPAGEAILADELTFMDKPANTFFAVSEHAVDGDERAPAALRALALVAGPGGEDAGDFVARYEADWLPRLQQSVRMPAWCLQNRALAMGPGRPAFDAVSQIHAGSDAGLADWAAALAAEDARVLVLGVEECESDLAKRSAT